MHDSSSLNEINPDIVNETEIFLMKDKIQLVMENPNLIMKMPVE